MYLVSIKFFNNTAKYDFYVIYLYIFIYRVF